MKKYILKPIFYLIFFIFISIILLPKTNLYYYLEKQILPYGVIISNESVEDKLYSFKLEDGDIYYNNIKFGYIQNLKLDTLLIHNELNINNLIIDNAFKNFLPRKIKKVQIKYSIFSDPLNVHINSNGDMGKLLGVVSLLDRKITLEFDPSNIIKQKYQGVLRKFKFNKGKYIYEYKF